MLVLHSNRYDFFRTFIKIHVHLHRSLLLFGLLTLNLYHIVYVILQESLLLHQIIHHMYFLLVRRWSHGRCFTTDGGEQTASLVHSRWLQASLASRG